MNKSAPSILLSATRRFENVQSIHVSGDGCLTIDTNGVLFGSASVHAQGEKLSIVVRHKSPRKAMPCCICQSEVALIQVVQNASIVFRATHLLSDIFTAAVTDNASLFLTRRRYYHVTALVGGSGALHCVGVAQMASIAVTDEGSFSGLEHGL